ncbi:MAG TPA: DUF3048 domain-containing protein [Candidatus Acidoferrales bacterium]|nr:DUF3048 domain-containing protein [Candidatus Acidoferrales bacterium]
MNKKVLILLSVIVFLLSSGVSYYVFSLQNGSSFQMPGTTNPAKLGKVTNDYQALTFDPNVSKTEECPLTGVKYGKDQAAWWGTHRPLGIMIENSAPARPQSGINAADVTYEAIAEGGITRTMNIFYCQDAGIVGPVRSARTYFLDWISEYGNNPLYTHVGGANTPGPANALGQIVDYGWNQYNDLNQFSIGFPIFYRDETRQGHEVATEHTMYSVTSKLWDYAAQNRSLTNVDKSGKSWETSFVPYKFTDAPTANARPTSQVISIPWSGPDYAVTWTYHPKDNLYYRDNGGSTHIDRNTHKQLTTTNIIILFQTEKNADDGYEEGSHQLYGTTGSGDALVFMNGKEVHAKWSKADRTSRTTITDTNGNEVTFTRGKLWYEVLDIGSEVDVQ